MKRLWNSAPDESAQSGSESSWEDDTSGYAYEPKKRTFGPPAATPLTTLTDKLNEILKRVTVLTATLEALIGYAKNDDKDRIDALIVDAKKHVDLSRKNGTLHEKLQEIERTVNFEINLLKAIKDGDDVREKGADIEAIAEEARVRGLHAASMMNLKHHAMSRHAHWPAVDIMDMQFVKEVMGMSNCRRELIRPAALKIPSCSYPGLVRNMLDVNMPLWHPTCQRSLGAPLLTALVSAKEILCHAYPESACMFDEVSSYEPEGEFDFTSILRAAGCSSRTIARMLMRAYTPQQLDCVRVNESTQYDRTRTRPSKAATFGARFGATFGAGLEEVTSRGGRSSPTLDIRADEAMREASVPLKKEWSRNHRDKEMLDNWAYALYRSTERRAVHMANNSGMDPITAWIFHRDDMSREDDESGVIPNTMFRSVKATNREERDINQRRTDIYNMLDTAVVDAIENASDHYKDGLAIQIKDFMEQPMIYEQKHRNLQFIFVQVVSMQLQISLLHNPREVEAAIDLKRRLRALETARSMLICTWKKRFGDQRAALLKEHEERQERQSRKKSGPGARDYGEAVEKLIAALAEMWGSAPSEYKEIVKNEEPKGSAYAERILDGLGYNKAVQRSLVEFIKEVVAE